MSVAAEQPARGGRPRDPEVDRAIRTATLALLVEEGYPATSIQAVARRAGVSAPSIYRRWSSKAELVEAAVFPSDLVEPTAGGADLETDLVDYCRRILTYLGQPAVRAAIPGLLSEYHTDPQMWRRLVTRTVTPMRESFETFLRDGGREPVGSLEALFEVILGALFARAINVGLEGADAFAAEVALIVMAAVPAGDQRRRRFGGRR